MTFNMHQESSQPSSSTGNNGSLFNPDEVRFMQDSLSSADSFDPFTIGAPGFKVPNVLPANLGGIGSAPKDNNSAGGSIGNGMSNGWANRENQMGNDHHQQQHQHQLHQLQQQQSQTSNAIPLRGGYGRDKAWQLQQLEALQAEREKYVANQRQQSSSGEGEGSTSSSSMPDFNHFGPTGHSLNGIDTDLAWLRQNQLQSHPAYPYSPPQTYPTSTQNLLPSQVQAFGAAPDMTMNSGAPLLSSTSSSSQDLSHLALRYPSSHQFPADPREEASTGKRQRGVKGGDGTGTDCEEEEGGLRRGRSPNTRPPWTNALNARGTNEAGLMNENMSISSSTDSFVRDGDGTVKARSKSNSGPTTQQLKPKSQLTIDMDAPYTFLPAPRPPPKLVDVSKAEGKSNMIPPQLSESFFSPNLCRFQPHLMLLRQEQMKRKEKGLSANIRKGDKKVQAIKAEGSPTIEGGVDGGDGEKKKVAHVLLTEAEKKANHIASEQKRRANIRKGYELLCDLIPALRDGEEGMGMEGAGGGDDDDDDDDEDDDDQKKGKRRRDCDAGDKIEGRGGPRSEAAILMAAVQHLRSQLEVHRELVVRKQEAQLRLAQRYGLDIGM